ncbi:MAG: DUF1501 domain-containing protein [Planctomycetales bacterium]|nr:DUF1501 domain-containing protein [Planctomycetales bacterium]
MSTRWNLRSDRRAWLQRIARGVVGGCAGFGLNWAGLMRARAVALGSEVPGSLEPIRSCILVFQYGGPSHLDTFDMKSTASSETRSEFREIATSLPGVNVCEHLPHMARVMHKVTQIRSMSHTNRLHDSAATEVLTGYPAPNGDVENFAPFPQFYPSFGSTMSFLRHASACDVPFAALPWAFHNVVDVPCQGGGFLGNRYDPFQISVDPAQVTYNATMLERPDDLSFDRIADRLGLLSNFERGPSTTCMQDKVAEWRRLHTRAVDLLAAEAFRDALNVDLEDRATRERYGMYDSQPRGGGVGAENAYAQNMRGQNLLLARRLVEVGVPFVNVYDYKQQGQNWDAHSDNFGQHRNYLLPAADRGISALIDDLDERGLLDSTLVVVTGEFGRTPKINGNGGRDHWPDCYTVLLAGGGAKRGFVYGASDRLGAYPLEKPVSPADLAATIYWRFGVDPRTEVRDTLDRPHRIAEGTPVRELFV